MQREVWAADMRWCWADMARVCEWGCVCVYVCVVLRRAFMMQRVPKGGGVDCCTALCCSYFVVLFTLVFSFSFFTDNYISPYPVHVNVTAAKCCCQLPIMHSTFSILSHCQCRAVSFFTCKWWIFPLYVLSYNDTIRSEYCKITEE
jgi:hypothetical protein